MLTRNKVTDSLSGFCQTEKDVGDGKVRSATSPERWHEYCRGQCGCPNHNEAPEEASDVKTNLIPPNPWTRMGLSKVMWEYFWGQMSESQRVSKEGMKDFCQASLRGQFDESKFEDWTVGKCPITQWMRERTGFLFNWDGVSWTIKGKKKGVKTFMPWDDPDYQKAFEESSEYV